MSTSPFGGQEPSSFEGTPAEEEATARSRTPFIIAGAGAAAVLALGVGAFLILGQDEAPAEDTTTTAAAPAPAPAEDTGEDALGEDELPADEPTVVPQFSRNPFTALVTSGGGAATGTGGAVTGTTTGETTGATSGETTGTTPSKGNEGIGSSGSSSSGASGSASSSTYPSTPTSNPIPGPVGPRGEDGQSLVYISLGYAGQAIDKSDKPIANTYVMYVQGLPIKVKVGETLGTSELKLIEVRASDNSAVVSYGDGEKVRLYAGKTALFFLVDAESIVDEMTSFGAMQLSG